MDLIRTDPVFQSTLVLEEIYVWIYHDNGVDVDAFRPCTSFSQGASSTASKKLDAWGIEGKLLYWLANWLRDSRQKVGMEGIYSEWQPVLSGIPQGSLMAPVLFCIYDHLWSGWWHKV